MNAYRIFLTLFATLCQLFGPISAQQLHAEERSGHQLLVTSVRTGDTEVFIADPVTGDMFNVTRSRQTEDRYPCWSPDGKLIAFTRDAGPNNVKHLWVIDADGQTARALVSRQAAAYMPSWRQTPDGERIVFGLHGDKPEMAMIRPDGTDLKILGEGHDPTLSPDGSWISFRRTDERYWSDPQRMEKIYREKPADKRPVWVSRSDGSQATVVEPLRFQMAIDGSRASWKPRPK